VNKVFSIFILILIFCFQATSQNINGIWKGTLTMRGGCFAENFIELQINISGNRVTGDSYHYLNIDNYIKKSCSGSYDAATKTVIVQEDLVTTYKIPYHCLICIKKYTLTYSKEGNVETLSGGWTGNILDSNRSCLPGTITLSRVAQSAFKEIPEVKVDTGTLRLDFYDNAEVDGDSITVKVNGKVVLSHQLLTSKAVTTQVIIDLHNTFQEIEMIAENQGSIPPNTALLVVTAGDKKYQLYLTSTEEKNARVRFVYERPRDLVKE
jgi:hypothetical protein